MQESFDFRILESQAIRFLPADLGTRLSVVRQVIVSASDPAFARIGSIDRTLAREEHRAFIASWQVRRDYSEEELEAADLLRLKLNRVFEPAGEECGTRYDENSSCQICGAGARQAGPLFLPMRKLPTKVDVAKTIGGEIVVSQRFVDVLASHLHAAAEFVPVQPFGRVASAEPTGWYQMHCRNTIAVRCETRVGKDPFDSPSERYGACPRGDVAGLNLLSELHVDRGTAAPSDIWHTREYFGVRQGLLRPEREIVITQHLWRAFEAGGLRGATVEIAR